MSILNKVHIRRRPSWTEAIAAATLIATAAALYIVGWRSSTTWHWVPTIALGYLIPATMTVHRFGLKKGLGAAAVSSLTVIPLMWKGRQMGQPVGTLTGLGATVVILPACAYLWGWLIELRRRQQMTEIQRSLYSDIGSTIVSGQELDSTLNWLMGEVRQALNVESGSLLMLEGGKLVFRVSFGPVGDQLKSLTLELGQGIAGWVAATGESLLVPDTRTDKRYFGAVDKITSYETKSLMCVPLKGTNERVIGVLEVMNPLTGRAFAEQDRELLESIANFAVIAIQNAQLYQRTLSHATDLYALYQVGKTITSTLDVHDALHIIAEETIRLAGAARSQIILIDPDEQSTTHHVQAGFDASPEVSCAYEQVRQGVSGWVLNERISALAVDVAQDARIGNGIIEYTMGHDAQSLIVAPLLIKDQAVGVLDAARSIDAEPFTERELGLLNMLAGQASIAIENAQLYTHAQGISQNLEHLVDERTEALAQANRELTTERDRLNALYRITRELSGALELDRMLNRTLTVIAKALDLGQGYVFVRDSGSEFLRCRASTGSTPPAADGRVFPAPRVGDRVNYRQDQGLIGRTMISREFLCIGDLSSHKHWHIVSDQDQWHHSLLSAPLISGEDCVGIMILYHSAHDHFTAAQQRMMEVIASQIAITISSIEMFHLLSEAAERLGVMLHSQQMEAARSQAILEGVADGVVATDAAGRITLFNAAAERIFQTPRSDVIGRSEAELPGLFYLSGTSLTELARRWSEEGDKTLHQDRIEFQDRIVSVHLAPILREDTFEGTVSVFRDVTKDVEVDRLKSEFVTMVSHELRTPMTSLKGYIDLLYSEMAGPISENQRRFLKTVKANADRLTVLLNSLLEINRLHSGELQLALEAVDPMTVIDQVIADLMPKATDNQQHLTIAAARSLPHVRADPARLKQVLINLVDNALNYTAPGGQITVEAQVVDDYLLFHVIDNGIGISSGDQEKLFSRFFRGDDPLVQAHSGTGMGLFIVKSIVELHGGEVWLESKPGEGSRFSFSLPVVDQETHGEPDREFKTISYRAQDLAPC